MAEVDLCPWENVVPLGSPGVVHGEEVLVRFVELREHVKYDDDGARSLAPAAVRQDDLVGRNNRSFSLVREGHIDPAHLRARAASRTSVSEWKTDPVVARTTANTLRALRDDDSRREICINSDPFLPGEDALGACPAHAGAVRSNPPLDSKKRLIWQLLRTRMGECFGDIRHLSTSSPALKGDTLD